MKGQFVFSSANIRTIFIVMLSLLPVSLSKVSFPPCSYNKHSKTLHNQDQCLEAIREAANDENRFWFGKNYDTNCKDQPEFSSNCYNPKSEYRDSLFTRIFPQSYAVLKELKTILKIHYKTHVGSYQACGNYYEIYKSRNVDIINPLTSSNLKLSSFELLSQPRVSWDINTPNDTSKYLLAMIDAGYLRVHALYIDIPGTSLDEGQTIVDYLAPINPTSNDNPYVFLLFAQPMSLELSVDKLHQLSLRSVDTFEEFLDEFGMESPVGLSWFTIQADPYSADSHRNSPGNMNTCAHFVNEILKKKTIPYLPQNTPDLNVYLDITFEAPAVVFNCCCNTYSYEASTYKPNPIGDGEAKAWLMRSDAERSFVFRKSTAFPLQSRDFENEYHTLIMVDPDSPVDIYGSQLRPYTHMLVSNIPEGEFKSGEVILPYSGPWPPSPNHHTYYFLLFKQKQKYRPKVKDYAFMNCTGVFNGRCGFNMDALIRDGGLELVGASWQLIKTTPYVRCVLVGLGNDETQICAGVDGYTPKCEGLSENNNNGSPNMIPSISFLTTLILMNHSLFRYFSTIY